ncbi:relaxase/mobilization nuclease RlxS [Sphingosinicella terrae]|uniref:relaxase/mobilization nuclease RlxS n=1 Tax=Sphingosinicella terrae TaxID=2172047 RepID=UPI000E0D1938|nr:relaxase/mobilization nuclease RlxS [Sphingosinicella terrae]
MAQEDDFELWLGRIGDRGRGSGKRFANRIRQAAQLAGGPRAGGATRKFDGSRIGRGAGVGRVLSSGSTYRGPTARRVVVKASIVKLGRKGLARATAHMRYLQRDGTTREGERGALYSEREDRADGKGFVARGEGDRHQFRFIVAPEDGSEYENLKPLVRRFMAQAEKDLGTKLDWVAVDHFNTGYPHSHVIVRGKDDRGKDLIIAREYLTQGLRERAAELVNLDLGPRTEREILRSQLREVEQERLTGIDRRLIRSVDAEGLVDPRRCSWVEQDLRTARLRTLSGMGLATEQRGGRWKLDPELESTLREMGRRGDIVRTMNYALKIAMLPRAPQDQAIYDPDAPDARPVVGRLVASGLSDEHADRHFLIIDGVDGHTHYVDVGNSILDARPGAIVQIEPRQAGVREVDRTVAAIAEASKGWYSVELHQFRDPTASEPFATAHIRRLEALRRSGLPVVREVDGYWQIAPDHLERVEAHERRLRARMPVTVALLSGDRLELLPERDGATWLDRAIVAEKPVELGRGFGAEVRKAIDRRLQWLAAQRLIDVEGEDYHFRPDLVDQLERRELRAAAARIGQESGRAFRELAVGDHVDGICRGPVQVGDRTFALVEHSLEFSLVPWRPVLERQIGREISGVVRGAGISWTIGRERQGPSIGM